MKTTLKIAKHDTIRYYVKCKKERSKLRQDLNQFAANLVELLHFSALKQCIKFAYNARFRKFTTNLQ